MVLTDVTNVEKAVIECISLKKRCFELRFEQ